MEGNSRRHSFQTARGVPVGYACSSTKTVFRDTLRHLHYDESAPPLWPDI